ncbi:MAG: LTA synthase family protein [Planctomycetota bacterium]
MTESETRPGAMRTAVRVVVRPYVAGILLLFASRLALSLAYGDRLGPGERTELLAYGLWTDVVTLSYGFVPIALMVLLAPGRRLSRIAYPYAAWLALLAGGLVGMELLTWPFIAEYDNRPNRIFVEYIGGSQEIAGMVFAKYLPQLVLLVVGIFATVWFVWRASMRAVRGAEFEFLPRLAVGPVLLVLLFLGARGTLDHRPFNASNVFFSDNQLASQLALNSSYSAAFAAYNLKSESAPDKMYGTMPADEMFARVRSYMDVAPEDFLDDALPLVHHQRGHGTARNVVVLLQESLGAEFVGCLGGLPLTPNLDRLADEGVLFTALRATGTRTVRGMEAVLSSFLPTPGSSVVKLEKSQSGFFTIATLLAQHGYESSFVYGGESHFDNMRRFLLGNGFTRIHDRGTFFEEPVFEGTWGVSDEDLMREANLLFRSYGDQPFFSLVLSTSNHTPYEYPAGRFEPYEPDPATRNNAVMYADYSIGKFFELAKQEDYYEHTVFVVVADHDARVYGHDLVPVDHYRIPALVIAPGLEPERYDGVASQIDLPTTALGLTGLDLVHPMIGRDLLAPGEHREGRAVMQYYDTNAFLAGDRVIVHQPHKEPRQFRLVDEELVPEERADPELVRDALAHALLPWHLYDESLYRLEP